MVPLIDAAIASASIPAIFAPQKLGSENFIDGGVRDVLPIRAALDAGADQVYAVTASRAGVDGATSFDNKTILDIAERAAADIMPDQIQSYETNPPSQPWPDNVLFIQPDFTVHDASTIDPGLIRINSFYGYMRAAEQVDFARSNNPDDIVLHRKLVLLSTAITKLRFDIWTAEFGAAGQRTPDQQVIDPHVVPVPSPELFRQVREMKTELKNLLELRAGLYDHSPQMRVTPLAVDFGAVPVCAQATRFITVTNWADAGMPSGFSALWLEFEAHPWINPAAVSPWSRFDSVAGHVDPATPPPSQNLPEDLQISLTIAVHPFTISSYTSLDVPPGGSATIAITMGSPAAAVGPVAGTLLVNSNDPNNPGMTVQLTGTFVDAPPTAIVPSKRNFGIVPVDATRTLVIMIRNTGCGDLTVSSMDVIESGPLSAFSLDGPAVPFTVASGGKALIQLSFSPWRDQLFAGTLSIISNGAPSPATVSLLGTGRDFVTGALSDNTVLGPARVPMTALRTGQKSRAAVPAITIEGQTPVRPGDATPLASPKRSGSAAAQGEATNRTAR